MSSTMHSAEHARIINDAVRKLRRGESPEMISPPQCMCCDKFEWSGGTKMQRCSACKAVYYCNVQCATTDWKGKITPEEDRNPPHKTQCKQLKNSMEKKADMQDIARQFPWAKVQTDGSILLKIIRTSLDIEGSGPQFGWWTEAPCCNGKTQQFMWGSGLLDVKHLGEKQGWKLPDNHIPWLNYSEGRKLPSSPLTKADLSWADYYKWRGLPIESPACLLLHWPLSVWRLLDRLHLVPSSPPKERRKLTVHYIGVEREVDFLPIYGELALLLPNTDLELVFFGPKTEDILTKAKKKPGCLAAQKHVYAYTAPPSLGGGTVRIALSKTGGVWNAFGPSGIRANKPDAILACNAGISTYPEWRGVCVASRAFAIPFAVTDYTEQSLHNDIDITLTGLDIFMRMTLRDAGARLSMEERARVMAGVTAQYEMEMNPFIPEALLWVYAPLKTVLPCPSGNSRFRCAGWGFVGPVCLYRVNCRPHLFS